MLCALLELCPGAGTSECYLSKLMLQGPRWMGMDYFCVVLRLVAGADRHVNCTCLVCVRECVGMRL